VSQQSSVAASAVQSVAAITVLAALNCSPLAAVAVPYRDLQRRAASACIGDSDICSCCSRGHRSRSTAHCCGASNSVCTATVSGRTLQQPAGGLLQLLGACCARLWVLVNGSRSNSSSAERAAAARRSAGVAAAQQRGIQIAGARLRLQRCQPGTQAAAESCSEAAWSNGKCLNRQARKGGCSSECGAARSGREGCSGCSKVALRLPVLPPLFRLRLRLEPRVRLKPVPLGTV
jgi:hypothetical protein